MRRILKADLTRHEIDEARKNVISKKIVVNIHQFATPAFIIGDYPFVFRKQHNTFGEFEIINTLFALSSTRIYAKTDKNLENYSTLNAYCYNALVILHSKRYAASGNLNVLEKSVNLLKSLKTSDIEDFYKITFCENS